MKRTAAWFRWGRWIDRARERGRTLTHLLVHPDDWYRMNCPQEYNGLPVKLLGGGV